jgi:hypothetical protein
MTTSPFLTVDLSCDTALQMAKQKFSLAGLRALQTFDLHAARLALHDCPCPHHGTENCDCQMVVLLIYGGTAEVSTLPTVVNTSPATLILHGNDGHTWFSMADTPSQPVDKTLIASIQQALEVKVAVSA